MDYPIFSPWMWQLKSCPKCGGDRSLEITIDSVDLVCLQCGHRNDVTPIPLPVRGRPFKSKFKQQKESPESIY